jgi:hypothetical protein
VMTCRPSVSGMPQYFSSPADLWRLDKAAEGLV